MTLYKVVSNYVLNKVGVDKTVWHYFNGNLGEVDYSKSNSVKKRSNIKYISNINVVILLYINILKQRD